MTGPALTAKAVFDHAHEIASPAERKAYLDRVCADAPQLRQQVEALLRALDEAGSLLAGPAFPQPATDSYQADGQTTDHRPAGPPDTTGDAVGEGPGTQIGPYRLIEKLGEGGMGAVYLAEQEQPLRRKVALKIIKPGMGSAQVVARFQAERQALTRMEHPGIARVYDAGATAGGRPYFVMELVGGAPLTRFCDENRLTLRERLALFVLVCNAVQHAHQKGILHRDLKPSNVLVSLQDGKPVPKVIDFGLAKAIEQPLTDQEQLTQYGSIVGTLEYMSPEQADFHGEGVDTRTDGYSLGVMLYELLTGTTPLDRSKENDPGLMETLRRIREDDPPRPSARVAALGRRQEKIAAARRTDPGKLAKLLRGELDWIALKALEKERSRRYQTASELAADVQRYLDDEPVEACPPSTRYRLGKFARKHRALLGAVVGVMAALLVGLVVANAQRLRAEQAEEGTGQALKISDAMVHALARSRTKLGDNEKVIVGNMLKASRQLVLTTGTSKKALLASASKEYREANMAVLIDDRENAEKGYRGAIQQFETLDRKFGSQVTYRTELARSNFDLAVLLAEGGRPKDAMIAYRRAIELFEGLFADDPNEPGYWSELADAQNNVGALLRDSKELPNAEKAFREAVRLGEMVVARRPDILQYRIHLAAAYHNLGNVLRDQGKARDALHSYGKAVGLLAGIAPRPPDAAVFLRNSHWDRANALGQLGQHAEAVKDWQQAAALATEESTKAHLLEFLKAARLEEKLAATSQPEGQLLYDAAITNASATAAAAAESEDNLKARYARRAMGLLELAKAAGYFAGTKQVEQFRSEKAFTVLPRDDLLRFWQGLGPEGK